MDILEIAFIGYIVGAVLRTVYDFLWKTVDDPGVSFDTKYAATMLISIILSLISAIVSFTLVEIPSDGYTFVFLTTLAQGFMINHLVNKPIDYLSKQKAE